MILKLYVRANIAKGIFGMTDTSFAIIPTIRIERMAYIDGKVRGRLTAIFLQLFFWSAGIKIYTLPRAKKKHSVNPYQAGRKNR